MSDIAVVNERVITPEMVEREPISVLKAILGEPQGAQIVNVLRRHPDAQVAWMALQAVAQVLANDALSEDNNNLSTNGAGGKFITMSEARQFFSAIEWDWPGYVPKGHVALVAGEPGIGKSFLLAGLITAHLGYGVYPDGHKTQKPGHCVLLVETEGMRSEYFRRLAEMGVPGDKVVMPTRDKDVAYTPSLVADAGLIEEVAGYVGATMIVVDSLSGGHSLDENGADMRGVLQVLTGLASRLNVPVVVAHHPRKKASFETSALTLDRVRGSSTIVQFCRSVIGLWRPNPASRAVRADVIKASFCAPPQSFGFVIDAGRLAYVDPPEEPKQETALDRATEFLRAKLRAAPMRYSELLEEAGAMGISKNTLYRAKEALRVVAINGKWALPADEP